MQLDPNQMAFIQKIATDTEYKPQIHLRSSLKAIMAEEKQFGEIKAINFSEHYSLENEIFELLEYAQWIEAKADWIDPLVSTKDKWFSQVPKDGLIPPRARDATMDYEWRNEPIIERGLEKSNKAWAEFAKLAAKRP